MNNNQIDTYLKILGVPRKSVSRDYLFELNRAQLTKIPFENISKLYYLAEFGLKFIPDLDRYLGGIEKYHFGGTCYSNNYHFYQLLKSLGFDIILCGAQIVQPNGHMVSMVRIDNCQYIVDVGYAAPFYKPIPRDLKEDHIITFGRDKYVLKPKDSNRMSVLELYRNDELTHSYKVTDRPLTLDDFNDILLDSFTPDSTFMRAILAVRYYDTHARIVHNLSAIESTESRFELTHLENRQQLVNKISSIFEIPEDIVETAVSQIKEFKSAWS